MQYPSTELAPRKAIRPAIGWGQPTLALSLLFIGAAGLILTWVSAWNLVIWEVSGLLWHLGLGAYSLLDSARRRGWKRTAAWFGLVVGLGFIAEYIGSRYGVLFGAYQYDTTVATMLIAGQVPLAVLFEWWLVVYMVTGLTDVILGNDPGTGEGARSHPRGWILIAAVMLDALAAANLDLSIDPVSVNFYHYWRWSNTGAASFQGIPLSNYVSWLLVVGVISLLFRTQWWVAPSRARTSPAEAPFPRAAASLSWLNLVPVALYLIFQLKIASTALVIGLADVAVVSTLATLPFVAAAFLRRLPVFLRQLRILFTFVRPFTMLAPGVGFVSAGLMALGRAQITATDEIWVRIAIGALAAALLNAAGNGLNQVFDVEIDRINKPSRPLPAGELTRPQGLGISAFFYVVALVLALQLGTFAFLMFVLAAAATILYSVPPVRTKQRGLWANLSIAVPRGVLLTVAGWSAINSALSPEQWYLGLVFGLFIFGASTTKDLPDVEGDRYYNCATLPVVHGLRRTTLIIAPFFVLPWLLLPLGAVTGLLKIDSLLAVVLGLLLALWGTWVARSMYRSTVSIQAANPHRAWIQMYLMLIAAQGGFAALYFLGR